MKGGFIMFDFDNFPFKLSGKFLTSVQNVNSNLRLLLKLFLNLSKKTLSMAYLFLHHPILSVQIANLTNVSLLITNHKEDITTFTRTNHSFIFYILHKLESIWPNFFILRLFKFYVNLLCCYAFSLNMTFLLYLEIRKN